MMTQKSKSRTKSGTGTASLEFDDFELNTTMQEFLQNDDADKKGIGIWNFATISGLVMLFLALTFTIQSIGLPTGDFLANLSQGLIGTSVLPLIGGALITLVGFGFLVGDRKRLRKFKKAQRKAQKEAKKQFSDIHGSEETYESSHTSGKLHNALDDTSSSGKSKSSDFLDVDSYGYRHANKLMKSRTDKKWAGVCGGLAKYFGISATVVRFIFVAAFFMGYGTSLLIYFGLALAMPKEPIDYMDDFM